MVLNDPFGHLRKGYRFSLNFDLNEDNKYRFDLRYAPTGGA